MSVMLSKAAFSRINMKNEIVLGHILSLNKFVWPSYAKKKRNQTKTLSQMH